jgi:hypothetical protein
MSAKGRGSKPECASATPSSRRGSTGCCLSDERPGREVRRCVRWHLAPYVSHPCALSCRPTLVPGDRQSSGWPSLYRGLCLGGGKNSNGWRRLRNEVPRPAGRRAHRRHVKGSRPSYCVTAERGVESVVTVRPIQRGGYHVFFCLRLRHVANQPRAATERTTPLRPKADTIRHSDSLNADLCRPFGTTRPTAHSTPRLEGYTADSH